MASSAEFLIDIAAKMSGGSSAIAELAEMAERLGGVGKSAGQFDSAIEQVKASLLEATSAAEAAASSLAASEKEYARLEKAAVKAAKAVEAAQAKGRDTDALELQAHRAEGAMRLQAAAVDALRAKSLAAASAQERLASTLNNLKGAAANAAKKDAAFNAAQSARESQTAFGKLATEAKKLGFGAADTIDDFVGAVSTLPGALVTGAAAAVALTAAIIALTVAVGVAIVKTAIWGVGLADAKRNAALATKALEQTNEALVGIGSSMPSITKATGLTSSELGDLAKSLADAKVSAKDMPEALRAAALAEAALGKGGAAQFIANLKSGKKTVGEFASEMDDKFGGVVRDKMLGLDSQVATLKRNMGETFGGLDIRALLGALQSVVAMFDKNTATGRFMKTVFEGVFQPLINAAVKTIPLLQAMLVGVAIAALKIYIAFKPVIAATKELFGGTDTEGLPSALEVAVFLGKALGAAIAVVVAGVALLITPVIGAAAGFLKLYAAGVQAWEGIKAGAAAAVAFLDSISLSDVAANMIGGLASGITAGAEQVKQALKGVVNSAVSAAKQSLGIASDSRVMMSLGEHTAGGYTTGVERGAGGARDAIDAMVSPPDASAGSVAPSGATGGPNLAGAIFNFYGVKDAEEAEVRFKLLLRKVVAGDIASLGGAVTT